MLKTVASFVKWGPSHVKVARGQIRNFHASQHAENMLIWGGFVAVVGGVSLKYIQNYRSLPKSSQSPTASETIHDGSTESGESGNAQSSNTKGTEAPKAKSETSESKSVFSSWFDRNYYEGGFEDKMTKREAALILGVRESATGERIKEAHRRILLLNHPDRGGSAFVAAKINEAKDLLMKGKQ